jgi:hypothetical protein
MLLRKIWPKKHIIFCLEISLLNIQVRIPALAFIFEVFFSVYLNS